MRKHVRPPCRWRVPSRAHGPHDGFLRETVEAGFYQAAENGGKGKKKELLARSDSKGSVPK
jgi:hypothetical protein